MPSCRSPIYPTSLLPMHVVVQILSRYIALYPDRSAACNAQGSCVVSKFSIIGLYAKFFCGRPFLVTGLVYSSLPTMGRARIPDEVRMKLTNGTVPISHSAVQGIRGVDLCQTLGGPNPFPPHPYPLPLLPPFPSSLLLLPFVPPSPPFPPLPLPSPPLGVRGIAPGKFFSGTHARTRVLVHF
jgi:hypothetical protein